MASDFDDIFGDLKEDQPIGATLTTDLDAPDIFGDGTGKAKATTLSGQDQDEFLSWLDDAPSSSSSSATQSASIAPTAAPPTPAPAATATSVPPPPVPVSRLQTVDLGDDDDDDFLTATPPARPPPPPPAPAAATHSDPTQFSQVDLDDEPLDSPASSPIVAAAIAPLPTTIPVHVHQPPALSSSAPTMPVTTTTTIALDDDDDDDDLEKIVQQANAAQARKAGGSRESSNSSLHIKSQRADPRAPQQHFDCPALIRDYVTTGRIAEPAARVAMWAHALGPSRSSSRESVTMYAVQTTPLDLPNQPQLRKDVEGMCSAIFASGLHAESLQREPLGASESVDATRLLFIDNAEILVTYVCKKLGLGEYPTNLATILAPAIAAAGNDPLRLDLVGALTEACSRLLPHLTKQLSRRDVADGRRALLKWLLLYHAPGVAFHLDQHFHQWNAVLEDGTAAIPESWVVSMLEREDGTGPRDGDLDMLIKVWDCCLLLLGGLEPAHQGTRAFPSTTGCFILVHLLAKAEKKLVRMEGEQLRHCMTQAILDGLKDRAETLVVDVRRLIAATPPGFCVRLRDAGQAQETMTAVALEDTAGNKSNRFSLIAASTNGVKQVGNLVIDMPTKLLTTMAVPLKSVSSAGNVKDTAHAAEELFQQLVRDAAATASVCMPLPTAEVIPVVFRSFQAAPSPEPAQLRYFIIDCRAQEETQQGQVPTAFHFDPDAVTDPQVLDAVLATLNPIKSTVHFCVMGHGYGRIAEDLRALTSGSSPATGELPFYLQDTFLETFARDNARVNAAVLFLTKRGFPHVSVLEGGYAATHQQLLRSREGFGVGDLIDHDAPRCSLCSHQRGGSIGGGLSDSGAGGPSSGACDDGGAMPKSSSRGNSATNLPAPARRLSSTNSNSELDARSLFDAHTSSPKYFSSFAGAIKTGGKAMMNPAASLMDGQKWLMKKTGSAPSSPGIDGAAVKSPTAGIGLSKLKTSLTALGSESLDMLKKAEQVASKSGKVMFGGVTSSSGSTTSQTTKNPTSTGTPSVGQSRGGGGGSRNSSFQKAEEEVFTIDDEEEEEQDDFVGGGSGGSRTSSSSSMSGHRTDSFNAHGGESTTTLVLHDVQKDKIKELRKGLKVSRTQMLPFVESPFFSAYKKKKPVAANAAAAAAGRASMLPRRLVVAENHLLVLKAERNMDDIYMIKSCHSLAQIGRMTCLKKNALMVTIYYKWRHAQTGQLVEKKNAYEVQQRDEFIKVIKNAMEKM